MSDKTRHAIAARLAANRKATGVAIREPKPAPKKAAKVIEKPIEAEPVVESVETPEEIAEEPSGTDG